MEFGLFVAGACARPPSPSPICPASPAVAAGTGAAASIALPAQPPPATAPPSPSSPVPPPRPPPALLSTSLLSPAGGTPSAQAETQVAQSERDAQAAPDATPPSEERPPVPSPPRPAWTTATSMVHSPVDHPKGVADVVAHVPPGYDPSAPIHLVLFFHGSGQCITQLALGGDVPCRKGGRTYVGAGVAWRHDDAGTMSIFAAPQGILWGGGTPGRFVERGFFRAFVEELLAETFAPGLGGPRTLDDVASITLVGHSAGYMPIVAILRGADLDDKIDQVVLLDGLFSRGSNVIADWVERGLANGWPRKFVAVYGPWGWNAAHGRAIAARIERRAPGSTVIDPPGDLVAAARTHVVTVKSWPHIEHAWMLLVTMSKAIAGLDLPPRAVSPPAELAAPLEHAPEPIALGETMPGVIDTGDVRLKNGALADMYRLSLEEGQRVVLTARGGISFTEPCCFLDVVLRVERNGVTLAEDDDSAGGFDPRVDFVAPEAGEYDVRVSTYGAGERRGPYKLVVSASPTRAGSAEEALAPP